MVIRKPFVPAYENLWPSPSNASCLLFHIRNPSLDCALQYFRLWITTSSPGLFPSTRSSTTSPLPFSIFAWATPVLLSTSHENATVATAFFCQGIADWSWGRMSPRAACCSLVTAGSKFITTQESLPVLQSLPRSSAIQTFAPSSLVCL